MSLYQISRQGRCVWGKRCFLFQRGRHCFYEHKDSKQIMVSWILSSSFKFPHPRQVSEYALASTDWSPPSPRRAVIFLVLCILSNLWVISWMFWKLYYESLYLICALWGMLVFLFQWAIHPAAFRAQILTSILWVVVSGSGQLCVSPAGLWVCTCVFCRSQAGWVVVCPFLPFTSSLCH